jgi:GrpB-like predicted nucleotidyltransferase (UPF0157 family)
MTGDETWDLPPKPKPLSEEEAAAVRLGERKPFNKTIHLAPYDTSWPEKYAQLATRVREALAERVLLLEHVGSTSVPGLRAKPCIDMVLAVEDSTDEASYVPPLEARDFELAIREPKWFEHRLLNAYDITAHLHVFSAGCQEIDRMLAFRDWLRTHEDDRLLYEKTKIELAARVWKHGQDYADAKTDVVREILGRVLQSRAREGGT